MIAAGAENEQQFSLLPEGFMRSAGVNDQTNPCRQAAALAQRLEAIGINPYQSEKERYLVALQDSPGEIIEIGRPLRGTRFFASHAVRKNRPVVEDFKEFAAQDGLKDCVLWGIGLTGAKADAADLHAAMQEFNGRINIEFSELRKRFAFELLLLVVHPRFDPVSGLFDLHAHFVARVSPESREAVRRRLTTKFSKIDLPESPIRRAAAVATYMLWGIFRNNVMITWPDHALRAVWGLTQSRFRFVRSGGAFARWKTSRRCPEEKIKLTLDKGRREQNRAETADPRHVVFTGDRLLSKVIVKVRGVRIAALLFEATKNEDFEASAINPSEAEPMYSSATIFVTQESRGEVDDASYSSVRQNAGRIWNGLRTRLSRFGEVIRSGGTKIGGFARSALRRLL
ncbi:hypothetical protein B5K03_21575 [Rhizobium phaseoli]|uniref:hypothetical protein n=1 Tax=Rhizobium phaseoli TaxID=396 RepID=UPI000D674DF3|nr:hypothetical protein [Rhizobium phaseoli]PWI52080.1 hypothetical protein B5K03_21575 [Rhizobium phaseoli]